jgi:hypothetical protein
MMQAHVHLHLHPGAGSIVARVVRPSHVTPLRSSLCGLAVGTVVIPAWWILGGGRSGNGKATIGDARVHRDGLKDIRIGASEYI